MMIQYNFLNRLLLNKGNTILLQSKMPSSDMAKFRSIYKKAKNVVILTGAGVSAESGVPTFRGAGGMWRNYQASKLATPQAFDDNPSLVWEFYHYRREVVATKSPNKAHKAITDAQKILKSEGRELTLITQNVDELHTIAGTEGVLELHGSLFRTKCISCRNRRPNRDSPICEALRGKGDPNLENSGAEIAEEDLPHCVNCKNLLRPDVVWFGENLNDNVLDAALAAAFKCDLLLIVGTSSVVTPASLFAPTVSNRGVPVAEFNIEKTPITKDNEFYFEGPCGETLPIALAP